MEEPGSTLPFKAFSFMAEDEEVDDKEEALSADLCRGWQLLEPRFMSPYSFLLVAESGWSLIGHKAVADAADEVVAVAVEVVVGGAQLEFGE